MGRQHICHRTLGSVVCITNGDRNKPSQTVTEIGQDWKRQKIFSLCVPGGLQVIIISSFVQLVILLVVYLSD
jgi:hypothetical protein